MDASDEVMRNETHDLSPSLSDPQIVPCHPVRLVKSMAKTPSTVEIIGIVDSGGGGGTRRQGKPWQLGVQFSHWRIVGGDIETIPLYIYRMCNEEDVRPWMKSIQPGSMLRVKVRFTKSMVREQRRAEIIELIGKDRSDTELRAAAKDRRLPKIVDPFFKTLALDRAGDCYRGKCKWGKSTVDVCFDFDDSNKLNTVCRKAEAFWKSAKDHDAQIRAIAVRDLLGLKNESWLEQNEKEVSAKRFASLLKLTSVVVAKNGSFEFVFDDGDLFMGHDVVVHGTLSAGPRRADIEG